MVLTASFTSFFTPVERIYGDVKKPKSSHAVVSLELTNFSQSLGRFTPKQSENNPEILKGQKIAVGSCISCHNIGNVGGQMGSHGLSLPQRL